jgi:hypothetical protein
MGMLKQSSLMARCDVCRMPFDPVFGGTCTQCGKLLCAEHLYGSVLVKLAGYAGIRRPCVDCRRRAAPVEANRK